MLDWRRVVLLTSIGAVMSLGACAGKPLTTNGNGSVPLIPRDIIFGNPDRFNVQVSRDGKYLSYCAPVDNVLNVWVAPIDDLSKAKPVTRDTHRGVRHYYWPWTSDAILYLQDEGGNENWNVFRAPLDGGETTNLTPNPKVRAEIYGISDKHPDEMLVALNDRDAAYHDLHRVNVKTGKRTLVLENPRKIDGANVTGFVTDEDYAVRYAFTILDDGTNLMHKPQAGGGWAKAETIPMGDMFGTEPLFFDQTGRALYMKDTRGRDTSAIYAVDAQTGSKTLLAEDSATDADEVLRHPATKRVQAVAFVRERQRWQPVDPDIAADLEALRAVSPGDFTVDSRSHDDTKWVVAYAPDDGPWRYYLYDRPSRKAKFLFTHNSRLEGQPLVKMRPVTIKSRDGLDLVSYLSLPRGSDANDDGIPDRPLPMVLVVHGGPWGRDRWGYNSTHQWLANRGYAVLSVNFRASTGFGKSFVNAGNHEWGGKMHDDLIDGVRWAIDRNIAIPDRVAIHGGSYGGYSALAGVTLTPDVFACSVNIVGISNLITFLQTVPEYWKPGLAILTTRVGDPNTEEGRKLLVSRSPLTHVDRITKPLLIGHGANDARVKQSEADQIVAAMKAKGIPVTYVIYPDEGHGFQRPENRMSFNAIDEAFLSRHLGGRCEPVGDDFTNASIQIEYGAEHIPGLQRK